MGRLVTFLVLRFPTHRSEDLSIFQPLTDGTAKRHFRDFSTIMLKSLVICIVNCIYLKPSFLYSAPQNIFQWLIISLLWLALPHSLDASQFLFDLNIYDLSNSILQRRCYSKLWMLVEMRGFQVQSEFYVPHLYKSFRTLHMLCGWYAAV